MNVNLKQILKDWMLLIAMASGVAAYLIYHSIPALAPVGPYLDKAVKVLQPVLMFMMLFLSFCKIAPSAFLGMLKTSAAATTFQLIPKVEKIPLSIKFWSFGRTIKRIF